MSVSKSKNESRTPAAVGDGLEPRGGIVAVGGGGEQRCTVEHRQVGPAVEQVENVRHADAVERAIAVG